MYKYQVFVIPFVITWDGCTTTHYKRYCISFGIDKFLRAYILTITLKRTLESIILYFERTGNLRNEMREEMVERKLV